MKIITNLFQVKGHHYSQLSWPELNIYLQRFAEVLLSRLPHHSFPDNLLNCQGLKAKRICVLYVQQSRLCCVFMPFAPCHSSHGCPKMSHTSLGFAEETCHGSVLISPVLGGPGCHCDGTLLCKQHRNFKKKLFRIRDMLVQTGPRIYGSGSCYFRQWPSRRQGKII